MVRASLHALYKSEVPFNLLAHPAVHCFNFERLCLLAIASKTSVFFFSLLVIPTGLTELCHRFCFFHNHL